MAYRGAFGAFVGVAVVMMVAGAVGCVLGAADRGAGADGDDAAARAGPPAVAGAWSAADDLDKALGYAAAGDFPAKLKFTLDDKPGERWEEDEAAEIRAELNRLGHKLVATAQVRAGDRPAGEWIFTHRGGGTYGCVVVPNFGLLAHRMTVVPGAAADRDLLFVEWGMPDGAQRVVSAYRRGRAAPGGAG